MDIHYRPVQVQDAEALRNIKQSVWPEEQASLEQIQQVLALGQRICQVAVSGDQVVGFMDCFTTRSAEDDIRLEMDLLAVLPAFQGNGIASRLIGDCLQQAAAQPFKFARSLIQVGNIASQRAFHNNGFRVQEQVLNLYVKEYNGNPSTGLDGYPVWVNTLGYMGYWLEAPFSVGTPKVMQPYQTCGALIPAGSPWESAAQQNGYELIHPYQWWIKPNS